MSWEIDNRWSPGASGLHVRGTPGPETARAAYSARWIDEAYRAVILPDRQGFAYNDEQDRDDLIALLQSVDWFIRNTAGLPKDKPTMVLVGALVVRMRRAGGYVYVDAWTPRDPVVLDG